MLFEIVLLFFISTIALTSHIISLKCIEVMVEKGKLDQVVLSSQHSKPFEANQWKAARVAHIAQKAHLNG